MWHACIGGHLHIVNRLFELCTNDDYNYNICLTFACVGGHFHIVNKLIELGADFNKSLIYASYYKNMYIVDRFVKLGAQFENNNHKKEYENWTVVKKH